MKIGAWNLGCAWIVVLTIAKGNMKFGLKDEIVRRINGVFAKYPQVEKAIIYGSRAKGNFKQGSDIDLTLQGEGLSLSVVNKIRYDIDELLLPYAFDISVYDQIQNPDLVDHIERVGEIFYEKNSDF